MAATDLRPIRFVLNGEERSVAGAPPTTTRARISAPDRAADRHQGRLRRGRLRRLHGAACRAGRGGRPASPGGERLHPVPARDERTRGRDRRASRQGRRPSGAAGDGREARQPVRLLHAGLRHAALCRLADRRDERSPVGQGSRSPAISAAAPATARSSMPVWTSPHVPCRTRRRRMRRWRRGSPRSKARASSPTRRPAGAGSRRPVSTISPTPMPQHPDAVLVAGATDVGLWVTKQHRELPMMIDVTKVRDLTMVEERRTSSISARRSPIASPARRCPASTRTSARCCGALPATRSAMPARSAATSPTARPSATCRPA